MDSKKILDSIQLPTLSKTLLEIIEVEKTNPISFLDDMKRIIEKDPFLSAHVLKVANSPLYGFSQKVRTISHAIGLLGIRKVKNLAFSFSIFDFLKKLDYKEVYGGVFNLILKKSLLISACSTILARKTDLLDQEELYLSGLLAEIGQMIFFLYAPDTYCEFYTVTDKKLLPLEKETFQTDHIQLGIEFCDHFSLPSFYRNAIRNHYQLQGAESSCKIAFISNQLSELLLTEDEKEKTEIFKELENHTKKLLHLSLTEIEETVGQLPDIMDAFTSDFPEMQKDLKKTVETGSALIIRLMKKEMEMLVLKRELTDSREKLAREKMFLSHMLNLSYFFSSLMSPLKIISSVIEYFENFIYEFAIQFIYSPPGSETYTWIEDKDSTGGRPFDVEKFPSLMKSKISNEAVQLEAGDAAAIGKKDSLVTLVFPISYHHNFFGFLLMDVEKDNYRSLDLEMTYVQILSNIIANSFQNYLSFQGMKNESSKKKLVTRELLKFDEELNQSRETVIELQKAEILGELLPVIFHKLKNKLTPILGYSQILLAKVDDPSILNRVQKIEKNANELTTQLNLLRDYFKTDKVSKEKENLNRIIDHLKPYFDKVEATENIKINLDMDYSVTNDLLNSGQIEALITNLVENAVIAIRSKGIADGLIDIKTVNAQEGYTLIVRDNGIGISEEDQPRIWTPFYARFAGQPGIGLTVCEKIIHNHNGLYDVTSQQGEYTEFHIQFKPTLKEEAEPVPGPFVYEEQPRRTDIGGKILIVDDEAYLLDLMKEILLNEGNFDITTTTSGKEAIDLVNNGFDLVISDIRMPEVSGMDLYGFLKSKKMESKVIMVTADPYSDDVAEFLKLSRVEYLKKPFELMKFKQIVLDKLS